MRGGSCSLRTILRTRTYIAPLSEIWGKFSRRKEFSRKKYHCIFIFLSPIQYLRKIQDFLANFLLRKFSVNGESLQIFGQINQKSADTVRLRKIYSPENYVEKLVFNAVYQTKRSGEILTYVISPFFQTIPFYTELNAFF